MRVISGAHAGYVKVGAVLDELCALITPLRSVQKIAERVGILDPRADVIISDAACLLYLRLRLTSLFYDTQCRLFNLLGCELFW